MSLPFGKYIGQPLTSVPNEYLVWLAGFGNTIDRLAETVMLNREFDACADWIKTANIETTEECKNTLIASFRDGVMPNCIVGESRSWWLVYLRHKPWIYHARDEVKKRYICVTCLTRLRPIGTSRLNVYNHHDWEGRIMHKQCWIRQKIANEI